MRESTDPTIVAVLGGNAFAPPGQRLSMAGQFRYARNALSQLTPLLRVRRLLLGHGNGPQVGHMLTRVEASLGKAYAIPLEVCVAESEGELGYVLLQTLHNLLVERGERRAIASLLTQVVVDAADPAFQSPSKPIGPYYDAAHARALSEQGFVLREDSGRGYRRVVPSPEPLEVVDVDVVDHLLDMGVLVIAAGGGGIPVVREGDTLRGVDAVIDKDLTAALLARQLEADLLVIVTGVPCAYRHFGTSRQAPILTISAADVRKLAAAGHFPAGSMGPKMEAAARFVSRPGRRAIICDPPNLADALAGRAGTSVHADGERA
jgi:carbamate kinase